MNFWVLFVAALIPLIVGAVWYSPKVFGTVWMNHSGMSEEKMKTGNMALIFGLTYLFGLFIAQALATMTIHQMGMYQILSAEPGFGDATSEAQQYFDTFMTTYGDRFRTLPHGLLHGGFAAVTVALPIIGIVALFERKSWKYIMVHFGYWFVAMMLMGALIATMM